MPDPGFNPEVRIETVKFELTQANDVFAQKLKSVKDDEELREASIELLNKYTDLVDTSSAEEIKIATPLMIAALRNLLNLSSELKSTINSQDYDSTCNMLDGFSTEFVDNNGELLDQWCDEIDSLYQGLGAIDKD